MKQFLNAHTIAAITAITSPPFHLLLHSAVMRTAVGAILVIISAVCFGFLALFATWARRDGLGLEMMLFLRFGLAGLVLIAWMLATGARWPRGGTLLGLIGMGAILYVVESLCYFRGLDYAPSGVIAMLLYLYPAIVTVIARFALRERLTWTRLIALALALAGTMLLYANMLNDVGVRNVGIALGIGAALAYALYIIAGTHLARQAPAIPSATVIICAAAIVYGALALRQGWHLPATSHGMFAVLGLALFSTVIAIAALLAGLNRIGAVRASTLSTIEPMITVALGALVLGEQFHPIQLAGGGLIIIAAVIVARTSTTHDRRSEQGTIARE